MEFPALREAIERIRATAADGRTLSIRGGGTKAFYGEPARGEALETAALRGVTSYEPSELVVTVRAGTPLAELEALLAEQGQCLPFEPPRFAPGGTVGGMIAAGLSGPARASVGAVRDYLLGVTLVNGRGEVLTFGGQVMKNVAGYDVSRVLAGSMGTLGLIAEASLKVLPVAPAEATLEFACSQADALELLNEWGGRPLPLNASAWRERDGAGVLSLRLRGAVAAVEAACAQLGGERQDRDRAAAGWQSLRDQQHPWFAAGEGELWRLSVPQTAPVLAADGAPLVEWHGGQRWYGSAPGQGSRLRAAARAAGGHATLFRCAADRASTAGRFDTLSAPIERIHRALMNEFDPHAVFDRARLYPTIPAN
ncbi:glycolate oxidase subunit GlcE [Variovorax sp. M-6]|uniref:glycolate oxidase subunit GlcE n=1 Tax=Variovorax sp. M-6 TaxID=3233041 RepID=UPI003F9C1A13